MAKKTAKESKESQSSSASNLKMVLRKRPVRQSAVASEKEGKPNSVKKVTMKLKKKHEKLDSKMPKKPPTAFFYFLEDFRKEFQEQNPDVKSMRAIGKACGEKWKIMTYEEKVEYYDMATEKRAEFDRAMADYIKRKIIIFLNLPNPAKQSPLCIFALHLVELTGSASSMLVVHCTSKNSSSSYNRVENSPPDQIYQRI